MTKTSLVQFDNVSKIYQGGWLRRSVSAVAGVTFDIQPGEVFGLLGPNRAGKTTLVKMLLSLCRPTSGRVFRFGQPQTDPRTLARIGYMHENQAFPRYLTAANLLEYYGCLTLMQEPEVRTRVPQLLERVGLADRSREPITRFSKGMSQRLALAQALLNDPDLLVMDEPTEGLDLAGRRLVHEVAAEQRAKGHSVLLVSHSLADVEKLCDRVGVLINGRLAHLGPLASLVHNTSGRSARSLEQSLQEIYRKAS